MQCPQIFQSLSSRFLSLLPFFGLQLVNVMPANFLISFLTLFFLTAFLWIAACKCNARKFAILASHALFLHCHPSVCAETVEELPTLHGGLGRHFRPPSLLSVVILRQASGMSYILCFVCVCVCVCGVCLFVCFHPVAGKWHVIDFVFWCVCCVFLCVCVCPSCGRRVACHRFCVVCVYVCGRPHATPLPGQIDQYP